MKKIIVIIILLLIGVGMAYYLINYNSYENVKRYVINNQEKLLSIVKNEEIDKPLKIKQITVYDNTMVEFSMFSFTNQYLGFYYSKENTPLAFQNANVQLVKKEDNVWIWQDNGDNKGETIKIIDNWYYYKANL